MNKVFQHRLAYKVTTQEEADEMKAALLALGYTWAAFETNDWEKYPILYNDWNNIIGKLGFGAASRIYDSYLCTTSELFLALAAQVIGKKFHVGEYVVSESYNKADKISRIIEMDYSAHYHIVTELEPNNKWNQNHSSIRKATKEEIQDFIIPKQTIKEVGEHTFKIGDKVLIKESNIGSNNKSGDIGTIISFGSSLMSVQVQVEGRQTYSNYENANKLELVVENTNSDKQYVECTYSKTNRYIVGKQYEVSSKSSTRITIKQTPQLFMKTVQVTMFKAMDGSLHTEELHAIKANVRTIIDSIPDKDADDKAMHEYFIQNKEKINYLMNVESQTLWN